MVTNDKEKPKKSSNSGIKLSSGDFLWTPADVIAQEFNLDFRGTFFFGEITLVHPLTYSWK